MELLDIGFASIFRMYLRIRMHGEATDGNEPFILLYNPALEPKGPVSLYHC